MIGGQIGNLIPTWADGATREGEAPTELLNPNVGGRRTREGEAPTERQTATAVMKTGSHNAKETRRTRNATRRTRNASPYSSTQREGHATQAPTRPNAKDTQRKPLLVPRASLNCLASCDHRKRASR